MNYLKIVLVFYVGVFFRLAGVFIGTLAGIAGVVFSAQLSGGTISFGTNDPVTPPLGALALLFVLASIISFGASALRSLLYNTRSNLGRSFIEGFLAGVVVSFGSMAFILLLLFASNF